MALNTKVSVAVRNTQAAALTTALANGTLEIYSGTQPASPDALVGGAILLATLTLSSPAFGAPSGGAIVANTITGATAVATGTASWYRAKSSGGVAAIDGTVGTSASNLIVNSTSFTSGAAVNVTSWTHTVN